MKRLCLILISSAVFICGCQTDKQIPVTALPSSPIGATQRMTRLEGDSLRADKWEALKMNWHLQVFPECRDYMDVVLKAISTKTAALDYSRYPAATFDVRVEIYQDGRIDNVAIYGDTNIPPNYIQAIKDCSPFPKWPDKMRAIVGQEYWVMYISSGFGLTVPPG